jgi:pimeloyl-ACP methyl ester carboxylesterase
LGHPSALLRSIDGRHLRAQHGIKVPDATLSQIEIVPGSGHWIQVERPDALIQVIRKMVSTAA